jgi:hypothetical protein
VRAHDAGLTAFAGTVLTWENEAFNGGHYAPEGEAKRQALNAWIRDNDAFDAVIDFEAALRDPGHPTRMLPRWDSGDHLHPNNLGYRKMAASTWRCSAGRRTSTAARSASDRRVVLVIGIPPGTDRGRKAHDRPG